MGRTLIPLLFKTRITGRENFPRQGPLLVVGNHTAAMEAVLLNIYPPWQIERLSAADTPAEKITEIIADLYGVIPLHRGSYDRAALDAALDVLRQNGVVGIFPEGGIWQEGKKKALPGIAWLSYRSGAPVLPIGFSDTTGVINAALNLKRPSVSMHVGKVQPPASIPPGKARKEYLGEYSTEIMEEVHKLVPLEEFTTEPEILEESFQLEIQVRDQMGTIVPLPDSLQITQPLALAKFLHRPAILKIFKVNLELPIDALQELHYRPSPAELSQAISAVLSYLEEDNPYLLTYRFGVKAGMGMKTGLEELRQLVEWCQETNYQLTITPIRNYYSLQEGRYLTQIEQGQFKSWM
jgi:1-acyl-sn-glycerol-3-phosphate acyltransferase